MKPGLCCRLLVVSLLLIILIIGGGLILWQFLPQGSKATIAKIQSEPDVPTYVFQKCSSDNVDCCNGLDTICDMRADEILYAGLHNAMATREDGFLIAPNHQLNLEKALVGGYRAINVDIARCDGKLRLIHGRCQLGYRDPKTVFENLNTFLRKNPTEIVILVLQVVQDEGDSVHDPVTLDEIDAIMQQVQGLPRRLYSHPNSTTPWPTLRELRDSSQQLMLFHYNTGGLCRDGTLLCPAGFHDWFVYAKETEFSFADVPQVNQTSRSCATTRGTSRATFLAVNNFVTLPSRSASIQLNSIDFLKYHIQACADFNEQAVNVVFVDFWSRGNLPLYVQRQNTLRASAPPAQKMLP